MSIIAENIYKTFSMPHEHTVLNNISLTIEDGELLSIFGESGSGKSTLLYILASLDPEFKGKLYIDQENIAIMPRKRVNQLRNKKIGFVYQFHHLLHEFTVIQNIMLPALKQGSKNWEETRNKAISILEEMDLKSYQDKPIYELSGGQQQRIAIARALINDPQHIIADEPTGSLDLKNTKVIFSILKEIAEQRKKTVIIATHNATIYNNTHRAIEMIDGSLRL